MIIVLLLGLISHEPKTVLCKVLGGVMVCVLLVAHLLIHVLQFYLYICVHVSIYVQWLEIKYFVESYIYFLCTSVGMKLYGN